MFEKLRKLLNNIHNSDENVKKRWLVASSAITMVLIISLWLVYMNWTLDSPDKNSQKRELETGFWQIFKTGLNLVAESIWNSLKSFIQKITEERTIEIQ